jgi:hypothetical protein
MKKEEMINNELELLKPDWKSAIEWVNRQIHTHKIIT